MWDRSVISYANLRNELLHCLTSRCEVVARKTKPITFRHFDVAAIHKAFQRFTFTPLDEGLAKAHAEMLRMK